MTGSKELQIQNERDGVFGLTDPLKTKGMMQGERRSIAGRNLYDGAGKPAPFHVFKEKRKCGCGYAPATHGRGDGNSIGK